MQFFPERYEKYLEDMKIKEFKRQNPTGEESDAKAAAPREFGEIKSMKDWEAKCGSRKACAIGLLPAILDVSASYCRLRLM